MPTNLYTDVQVGESTYTIKRWMDYSVTIAGLSPDTSYYAVAYSTTIGTGCRMGYVQFRTPEEAKPDKWFWTSAEQNVFTSHGATTSISYSRWNDLVDKVHECVQAAGGSWNSSYASISNTKMTSSDKTLTATRYNSLVYNIRQFYTSGYAGTGYNGFPVSTGEIVYGSYFIYLGYAINQWIDAM